MLYTGYQTLCPQLCNWSEIQCEVSGNVHVYTCKYKTMYIAVEKGQQASPITTNVQ